MKRALVCWLVVTGACSAGAVGQRQITEEEFLGTLSPDHPAAAQARADIERARALRLRRAVAEDPMLSFLREDLDEAGEETTMSLAWTPPLDGRRGLGVRAGDAAIEAAEMRLEARLQSVRLEMRAHFAEWVRAVRQRDIVSVHIGSLRRIVSTIEARADSGEASRLAAARIRLAAVEAGALLDALESDVAEALGAVRGWDPTISGEDRPVAPPLGGASGDLSVADRADIRALGRELEQAELEARRGRRYVGFPELVVGWKELEAGETEFDGAVVGLSWSIPLGERGRGERLEGAADRTAAAGALELARSRAQAELESSIRSYQVLVESWRQAERDLAETDWMIEAAIARYQAGEAELIDLLDTLRSVLSARLAGEETYAGALAAQRRLEEVVGRPLAVGGAG